MQTEQLYPKHYCGVFGIFGHPNAAELTYYGLYALQHRGQESAGIVTCHEGKFYKHHGMGLVPQIFNGEILHGLVGKTAVGHTRYSTTGSSQLKNAQPLTVDCARGQIAIAHNGNLTNAAQLRDELENRGSIFQTTVDSEIILHLMAQPGLNGGENHLSHTLAKNRGRVFARHHDGKGIDWRARPVRFSPAVHRQARRCVCARQRNLRAGFDPREIRPRCRAGRNCRHQRKRFEQLSGVSRTDEARVLHF